MLVILLKDLISELNEREKQEENYAIDDLIVANAAHS